MKLLTVLTGGLLLACACTGNQGGAAATQTDTTATGATGPAARQAAFAANARLSRTINFGNILEAPKEGDWGLKLEDRFFALAREAGFGAIRLPIRWNTHAGAASPYTVDPAFFARIDGAVKQARASKLSIILDFHHYEELMTDPGGHTARFLAIWKQVAEHYKSESGDVLFEVLNEPNGKLSAVWNEMQTEALTVIRASNPKRVVIVGAGGWNSADLLGTLKLPDDPNLIATFHTYSPMEFTHQGTTFTGVDRPTGVSWPAPGLRPANGWANWSWDVKLSGLPGGLQVSQTKAYGALYVHHDAAITGVSEVRFVTDRALKLGVVCLESNDGKSQHPTAYVDTQAGAVTRVPVKTCGGTGTVRDVWLMAQGTEPQPAFTVSKLELLSAAGPQSMLGNAEGEASAPIRTAAAWGKANNRPVFMGEFGAFRAGPEADRVRWATALRSEAEKLGVSWAWWELASGFGVYNPVKNVWDAGVVKALLPETKVK